MRRFFVIIIPIVLIGCFILVMESASILKMPRGEYDDVPGIISTIEGDISKGDWKSAKSDIDDLEKAWKAVEKRVQFGAERDELMKAESSIARAKGYIISNDKAGTLSELYETKEHWMDIGK